MSNPRDPSDTQRLAERLAQLPFPASLRALVDEFQSAVFTTSFSLEDQVILHAIASDRLPVRVVTLDTGRLFEETYQLHARSSSLYQIPIESYFPNAEAAQALLAKQGPNGFYDSVEQRLACCHLRKVEPLGRALRGADVWITGIRREHSPERQNLPIVEWDTTHGLYKFHPLLTMTWDEARAYAQKHAVPISPLHARGFLSIGCAPCTRAVQPGEPERAGRWWWENSEKKECGLHLKKRSSEIAQATSKSVPDTSKKTSDHPPLGKGSEV